MSGSESESLPARLPQPVPIAGPDESVVPANPQSRADPDVSQVKAAPLLTAFADVPIRLTIELGRLDIPLKDLVGLKLEKVFRLAKPAGEPFDLCANGLPVARGEVVVDERSAALRITEIARPRG